MEKMNKIWSLFAGLMLTMSIVSCEDLAFGERFAEAPQYRCHHRYYIWEG